MQERKSPEKRTLVWFRNDLRVHDHEALHKAAAKGAVVPVYCFDPRQFAATELGFARTGGFRTQFLREAVADLRQSCQKLGSDLIIRVGKPEDIIPGLVELSGATAVFASKEVASYETRIEEALEAKLWAKKIPLELFWGSTLFHLDDLPFAIKNVPDVFTEFRKESEKTTKVRATFAVPARLTPITDLAPGTLPSLADLGVETPPERDPRAVLDFRGGETKALQRLDQYFWEENRLGEYKETRNGLVGAGYSSKFSPWLSLGCLSPRQVYQEVKQYERERVKNESTYWLIFELLWRDYFRFIARKYGDRIFRVEGIKNDPDLRFSNNQKFFHKWVDGETGVPFIDANMRELKHTGFMSNRGRQNVASFLTKDLKINWTYGAMYFESQLLDYDVCSNWCNWNYVAGVGNDPRENRYFNIMTQAKRYDPQGEYVKLWLPELAEVPASRVHHVADLTRQEQQQYGVNIGVDYPNPLVSYDKWLV